MNERGEYIPIEYTKERPHVFGSEKGWELVRDFALRYGGLKAEVATKDITSSLDLVRRVEGAVGDRVSEALPEVFKKHGLSEEEAAAFLEAARSRSFSGLDFKDKGNVVTALGLATVAERGRTRAMVEALSGLDERGLTVMGMTPDQRDVVTSLLGVLQSGNPEYLRFKARSMTGEVHPERPVDAIREEGRIAQGIKKTRETLTEKGPDNVFGDAGHAFVEYLKLYEEGYQPLTKEGKPLTKPRKEQRYSGFRDAFEKFMSEHPDFPLILFPRGDEYVADASGLKLGRDPEIRVSWQSPELREEAKNLALVREQFIAHLQEQFGDLLDEGDLDRIKKNQPIIADDLGYFGIGMQVRFEAQELEGTSVMFRNVQLENRASTRETMKKLFGKDAEDVVDTPEFSEIANAEIMDHEWAHQVHHPEETKGAKNLKDTESSVNEMKSDLLSYASLHGVLGGRAEELYGERGREVLNMYMLGYSLDLAKNISPESEERPYWVSAVAMLNRLVETGVIIEGSDGATINKDRLRENLSEAVFEPQARELLEIYKRAETGKGEELNEARAEARKLGEPTPHPLVAELIEKVKAE